MDIHGYDLTINVCFTFKHFVAFRGYTLFKKLIMTNGHQLCTVSVSIKHRITTMFLLGHVILHTRICLNIIMYMIYIYYIYMNNMLKSPNIC